MNNSELTIRSVELAAGGGRIPAVITRRADQGPGQAVLLLHGLGANKEVQQKEASWLARAGLTAVTIDAPHHGARETPLLDAIRRETGSTAHALLLRIVREAIAEVPLLVDHLLSEGYGPVGLAGISLGAFIALGAMIADERLKAVVSILGSPDWAPPRGEPLDEVKPWLDEAPSRHLDRFAPRALLVANGGLDENVPPHSSRWFVEALRPYYAACPERLSYIEYPESSHFMREGDWNDLWDKTARWFRAYLTD
jgi:alpha-beta hydrolase superfamily lysophospholipase